MLGVTEAITEGPAIICTEIEFSKGVVSWLESMDFSLDGTHSKFAYNTYNDDALCANVFFLLYCLIQKLWSEHEQSIWMKFWPLTVTLTLKIEIQGLDMTHLLVVFKTVLQLKSLHWFMDKKSDDHTDG